MAMFPPGAQLSTFVSLSLLDAVSQTVDTHHLCLGRIALGQSLAPRLWYTRGSNHQSGGRNKKQRRWTVEEEEDIVPGNLYFRFISPYDPRLCYH